MTVVSLLFDYIPCLRFLHVLTDPARKDRIAHRYATDTEDFLRPLSVTPDHLIRAGGARPRHLRFLIRCTI